MQFKKTIKDFVELQKAMYATGWVGATCANLCMLGAFTAVGATGVGISVMTVEGVQKGIRDSEIRKYHRSCETWSNDDYTFSPDDWVIDSKGHTRELASRLQNAKSRWNMAWHIPTSEWRNVENIELWGRRNCDESLRPNHYED